MPDWSYRTLFRPLLFMLPAKVARNITLGAIGGLSKIPGGSLIIRTMGHMEVSPLLQKTLMGTSFGYPVGLSGLIDPRGIAHRAFAQFGIGFIEIGPVTLMPIVGQEIITRQVNNECLLYSTIQNNDGLGCMVQRMKRNQGHKLPTFIRISIQDKHSLSQSESASQITQLVTALEPYAAGFYLDVIPENAELPSEQLITAVIGAIMAARQITPTQPLLLYIPLEMHEESMITLLKQLVEAETLMNGVVLGDGRFVNSSYEFGPSSKLLTIRKTKRIRELFGNKLTIITSGGIHEPQDALEIVEAGADLVQLHSGLVYSGPGLPKRINEALLYRIVEQQVKPQLPSFWAGWGWMCLLGIGMMIGGITAWVIASTSVVLPYDLAFLCASPETLNQLNHRLLPFMSHDRVTLAGTMISIGVLYYQLGRYGLRRRLHWARTALMASGIVGFCSFFLYLGYGFFDPLHAAAAAVLLPMFVLAIRDKREEPPRILPNTRNDRVWQLAQRGQFMMVVLGFALAIGGITISVVGVTGVFVPEDLQFLFTTPAVLEAANSNLIPLIAHDRAGFGGALLSNAIGLLATALWGIQQGERWLWWTFLAAGLPAFVAAFSVHAHIGYWDMWHLMPAFFVFVVYILGLIGLYPYLMGKQKPAPGAEPIRMESA